VTTLVLVCVLFFLLEVILRWQYKRREGFFAVAVIRAGGDGMQFRTSTTTESYPWTTFGKFVRRDRVLVLYSRDHQWFRFIRRTLFSDDQWEALVRLVVEKVPAE
jgi:hypothetical protein